MEKQGKEKDQKTITLKLTKDAHHNLNIDKARLSAEIGRVLTWEEYFMRVYNMYRGNRK